MIVSTTTVCEGLPKENSNLNVMVAGAAAAVVFMQQGRQLSDSALLSRSMVSVSCRLACKCWASLPFIFFSELFNWCSMLLYFWFISDSVCQEYTLVVFGLLIKMTQFVAKAHSDDISVCCQWRFNW